MTKDIYQLAPEFASNIKTEQNFNKFSSILKKLTIEAALNAEMRDTFICSSSNLIRKIKIGRLHQIILFLKICRYTTTLQ